MSTIALHPVVKPIFKSFPSKFVDVNPFIKSIG